MVQSKGTRLSFVVFSRKSATGLIPAVFFCLAAGALTTFTSCGGTSRHSNGTDSTVIQLPSASAMSAAEKDSYYRACDRWFDTMLRSRGFNGGILVAKNGNVIFENYMGAAHLNSNDSIKATTPLHIASVSKTFTAMATLKLVQDGRVNLDDELVKYFPNFNYPGITVRSLLNHRSGLPNYVHFMEKAGWDKKKYVTNEDVFNYLVNQKSKLENIGSPNTRFNYCNTNYVLLALLIEKLSGEKYALFMQTHFFKPLQMNNTFVFDTCMLQTAAPSYDWKGELIPFNFLDAVYGDKNIYSTPQDLFTWDRALTSGKLFADSTLQEAYAPYSNEKPGIRNYGLGWRLNVYPDGKKMIYHNGWWHGNNAAFIRLVQDSATIIVVGNKFNRNIYHAKDLAPLFGSYGTGMEEEEEVMKDTLRVLQPAKLKKAGPPQVKKVKATPQKKQGKSTKK